MTKFRKISECMNNLEMYHRHITRFKELWYMFFRVINLILCNNDLFGGLRHFNKFSAKELLPWISYSSSYAVIFLLFCLKAKANRWIGTAGYLLGNLLLNPNINIQTCHMRLSNRFKKYVKLFYIFLLVISHVFSLVWECFVWLKSQLLN